MKNNMTDGMIGAASPELIQRNARLFWEGQNDLLDKMQTFANQQWKMMGIGLPPELIAAENPESQVDMSSAEAAVAVAHTV